MLKYLNEMLNFFKKMLKEKIKELNKINICITTVFAIIFRNNITC